MNILSQNGRILINYDNIESLYIDKDKYVTNNSNEYIHNICAYRSSKNDEYYILATFKSKDECINVFEKLLDEISSKNNFISLRVLCGNNHNKIKE